MKMKTHLAIALLTVIIFLTHVVHRTSFVIVFLIGTFLPHLEKQLNKGFLKKIFFKPLRIIFKERGVLHSFTFSLLVTLILVLYFPVYSLPFFLGHGLHLLADSWTTKGIKPLWPLRYKVSGRVGGKIMEETVFFVFVILDVVFAFIYLI